MRKLIVVILVMAATGMVGCLKDKAGTDLSHEGTIIEMMYPAGAANFGVGTGLEYFAGCTLLYPPTDVADTLTFYANIAGTNTLSKPLTVSIAVDNGAMQDNFGNDGITYSAMPDSDYTILKSSGTIPAGSRIDTFQIVVFPSKIDLTASYSLPIALSAPGYTVAANFGIMYLHTIGNPIAGVYNWNWTRWNNTDSSGPTSGGGSGLSAIFAPDNGTTIEVASGYYIQPRYVVTFDDNGGVLSNFAVTLNSDDVASMKSGGVTVTTPPKIVTADPVNGVYEFFYQVVNSSGPRTVVDHYTK